MHALIVDPSFEDGPNLYTNWIATGDAPPTTFFYTVGGLNDFMAPDGSNMAVLDTAQFTSQAGGTAVISISQSFEALLQPTKMRADLMPRAGDIFRATAIVGGIEQELLTLDESQALFPSSLAAGIQTGWRPFVVPIGATRVTFTLTDADIRNNFTLAFIDAADVPEPPTFILLALGLVLIVAWQKQHKLRTVS